MDGIEFKITGSLVGKFEETAQKMPEIEKKALYRAAIFMRDQIRNEMISKIPKANTRNPKYIDTLADAVGFTHPEGGSLNVNALGNRKSGSGTYRARFFEKGTQERYQRRRNGIKLKKKKSVGALPAKSFFQGAVQASQNQAVELMRDTITKYITEIFDGQ